VIEYIGRARDIALAIALAIAPIILHPLAPHPSSLNRCRLASSQRPASVSPRQADVHHD